MVNEKQGSEKYVSSCERHLAVRLRFWQLRSGSAGLFEDVVWFQSTIIAHAIIKVSVTLYRLGTRKVVNLCVCMFECIIIHWRSKFTNWFLALATSGTVLSRTRKVWPVCVIQSLNAVFHIVAFPAACTSPLDKLHAWWWRVSHR